MRGLTLSLALLGFVAVGSAPCPAIAQRPPDQPAALQRDSLYELALPKSAAERARAAAAIDAAINADFRPMDHRIRDPGREVRALLAAADVKPGDRVLDIGSGGGYLALLLSALVGEQGRVVVHNTPAWLAQFPNLDPEILRPQLNRANLAFQVEPWDEIAGEPQSYDVILMGQVYHDAVLELADIPGMNTRLFELLKPGGRLVIEDHEADPDMPLGKQVGLHRIAATRVIDGMLAARFRLSQSLAVVSAADDKRFNVFAPGIRGRTERFILVFEKPASP